MVKQSNGLSNKRQRPKIKGKGETRQDKRRPVLGRERKDRFLPTMEPTAGAKRRKKGRRTKTQGQGVHESKGEEKIQERREDSKAEGEGEEYLSKGEDGRPPIMEKDKN